VPYSRIRRASKNWLKKGESRHQTENHSVRTAKKKSVLGSMNAISTVRQGKIRGKTAQKIVCERGKGNKSRKGRTRAQKKKYE